MVAARLAFDPSHDAWNRLVQVEENVQTRYVFAYDGLGRRLSEGLVSWESYYYYFYNASWQTLETRWTGTANPQPETLQPYQQYVWSARYIDSPVLRDKNGDQDGLCDDERLYYLTDANFNVTTLVDTGGEALERYLYDPYGKVTIYDGPWENTRSYSSYSNEILYTGREYHSNTGIYNYRTRWYHPPLGRFLSRDLIEYDAGDPNLYRYVGNTPAMAVDPLGLDYIVCERGYGGLLECYWVIERNDWLWNPDVRRVFIGSLDASTRVDSRDQRINLIGEFGGGWINRVLAEGAALDYWNAEPDQSSQCEQQQNRNIWMALSWHREEQPKWMIKSERQYRGEWEYYLNTIDGPRRAGAARAGYELLYLGNRFMGTAGRFPEDETTDVRRTRTLGDLSTVVGVVAGAAALAETAASAPQSVASEGTGFRVGSGGSGDTNRY